MSFLKSDLNHRSDQVGPVRQGRRLTLFDIIEWIGILAGVSTGAVLGWKHSGIAGGAIGAVVGGLAGFLFGRLPLFAVSQVLGIRRKSADELDAIFQKDQYYIFHLALPELMSRGVDVSPHKPRILGLLLADDSGRRGFGWTCLRLAFPELASAISGFNSEKPSEAHLEKIRRFKQDAETGANPGNQSTQSQFS